jgi:hypothetical protein
MGREEDSLNLTCIQCGRAVRVEIATADERGQAVHPECYDLRLYGERSEWPEAYCKAVWEFENALLTGRIVDARREICNRLAELDQLPGLHARERQAISEAVQGLQSLEREDQRHKAPEIGKVAFEKISSISRSFTRASTDH